MRIYLGKISFTLHNLQEFFSIYKDVFFYKEYKFQTNKKSPFIIDCGSHIGIPLLYFKFVYPNATIFGFEANPSTFSLLKTNVSQNKLKKVKIFNKALSNKRGSINFYTHKFGWSWGDAGVKNSWYSPEKYKTIKVESIQLSKLINKPVDLLKMDIEGMELLALQGLGKKIANVKEMIIEFHESSTNKNNNLESLLKLLSKNGFSYTIHYPISIFNLFPKNLSVHEIKKTDPLFLIIRAKKQKQ